MRVSTLIGALRLRPWFTAVSLLAWVPIHAAAQPQSLAVDTALFGSGGAVQSSNTGAGAGASQASPSGPVRLMQTNPLRESPEPTIDQASGTQQTAPSSRLGEFENYVRSISDDSVRRLGYQLIPLPGDERVPDHDAAVPADYPIAVGDEVLLLLWGSVEADLRLVVDRNGRISLPRVGAVQVAGVRNADLQALIERRVSQVFRNFQLSVSLGQLRGIRIFVTGFVPRPGTYTVNPLTSVVAALIRAGGPAASGSFRRVELKRKGLVVATFDLYDLLLRGDRSADQLVQAGDVVHVGPVGTQIALFGSVNRPAILELRPGETVANALEMVGGYNAVADRTRLTIERLSERTQQRIAELAMPKDAESTLSNGDVIRAFNATISILATESQNKRITIGGEVTRPGEYVLPPDSTLQDAIRIAGGMRPTAFIYGTQFLRYSVRITQQENYDRALRDLETDLAKSSGSRRVSSGEDVNSMRAEEDSRSRLLQRLRGLRPSGRVVLQLQPQDVDLPALMLEDQDHLYLPPKPTAVGVFGSVFNSGSYLYSSDRPIEQYLRLAGGPTRGADERSIFVVRANGQVLSALQGGGSGWFRDRSYFKSVVAEPGDTVFVPEEMDKTTFVQSAKDWTQILYQFGIGLAGIKSAVQ